MAAQGALQVAFPKRSVAYAMWQYRLIGASPAEPGPATFVVYRLSGAFMFAFAGFLFFKFVTE
jgi:hypothetical protein